MKSKELIIVALLLFALVGALGCGSATNSTPVSTSTSVSSSSPTSAGSIPPTLTSPTIIQTTTMTTTINTTSTTDYASPPVTNLSASNVGAILKINVTSAEYTVFAWNDLGMHCLNPTYDTAVILPPYNTLWAQVVKRGNPPQVVTQGITVEYRIINNTSSYNKSTYGQFWDKSQKLFGVGLAVNTGLNLKHPGVHNGLSGQMAVETDHFEAVGVPLIPVDDSNNWNPYQVAEVTVKNSAGQVVAQTRAMAPVSDEMNCAKCHGADAYNDILRKHDSLNGTNLVNQKPVLCASCHGDPALGATSAGQAGYLSDKVHGFHSKVTNPPACYDCHPGQITKCSRSLSHSAADGNCTTCHGDLAQVSASITNGRVPWVSEPLCVTCHTAVAQVDTGNVLYRNSMGHGGVYCASCHGSPHAMVPSSEPADNYQAIQYQGKAVPIADCSACHESNRGGEDDESESITSEYLQKHGGSNPRHVNGCFICHTSINTADTTQWPHAFQWKARQ